MSGTFPMARRWAWRRNCGAGRITVGDAHVRNVDSLLFVLAGGAALVEEPRSANGVIALRLRRRTMRLRVSEPERCLALLRGNNAEGVRTGARQASTVKRGGTTTPSR